MKNNYSNRPAMYCFQDLEACAFFDPRDVLVRADLKLKFKNRVSVNTFSILCPSLIAKDAYTGYKQSILIEFRFEHLGEATVAGAAKLAVEALK